MSSEPPSEASQPSNAPESPLLDLNCDNPTRWEERVSQPETADSKSGRDTNGEDSGRLSNGQSKRDGSTVDDDLTDWNRQQKRAFHRVNTLLHYWEARDYEIVWVTLTSAPDSDDADRLSYNLQRLRQTIERARLAFDSDGEGHSLSHINQLEQLCIRTSEGPEGKGVLHLFWAWKPPEGNHGRSLYIPQHWLKYQWGRIHGGHKLVREPQGNISAYAEEIEPLYVWIEKYGQSEYHDRSHVARYCVTQYLGEHAEALEHISWSHGRTLGGSLTEAWKAIRKHREELSEAIELWEAVIGGEPVTLGSKSQHVHYGLQVRPPPNLGVEILEEVSVTPPREYQQSGPDTKTVRRSKWLQERSPDRDLCLECREYHVVEPVAKPENQVTPNARFECCRCGAEYVGVGDSRLVVVERELETWNVEPSPPDRDGTYEYNRDERHGEQTLAAMSRSGEVFEPEPTEPESSSSTSDQSGVDTERVRQYVESRRSVTIAEVMGRFGLPPEARETVAEVMGEP